MRLKSGMVIGASLAGLLCIVSMAHSQSSAQPAASFPAKPIKIVVGYAPGGPNDQVARMLASKLGTLWKQMVVIENRPGASGLVAGQSVSRSEPDGYTLLLDGVTHSIVPSLFDNLSWDPLNDFTAVAQVGYAPTIMLVNQNLAARTVGELIALAKSRPGSLNYGSCLLYTSDAADE